MINYGNRNTQILVEDDVRSFTEFLNTVTITEDDNYSSNIEEFKSGVRYIMRMSFHELNLKRMADLHVVPALVRHLLSPITEVALTTLRALKIFAKHDQEQFNETDVLLHIINFLNTYQTEDVKHSLIHSSVDFLTYLASTSSIANRIRILDGIPPLIHLLNDMAYQKVVCSVLEALSTNDENATQIVDGGAVPCIIRMLHQEDEEIHLSVFKMIHNLDRACEIIRGGLLVEAFHPLTELMSSTYFKSQRLAIDLLDLIVKTDQQWKIKLIQRGLVPLLTKALASANEGVQESSVILLNFLAEDSDNQVGIVNSGGLVELLKVLDTKLYSLKIGVAYTLYHLADNKDNVCKFIMVGGVQRLLQGDTQAFNLFQWTLERLAEKINGHVLTELLHRMGSLPKGFQIRIALALAHLCLQTDSRRIFIDNYGLELLTELLGSSSKEGSEGAAALLMLASKFLAPSPVDDAPSSIPHPGKYRESFADTDGKMSDIIFSIEGQLLHAHKSRILNASKVLSAMVTKSKSFVHTTAPAGTARVETSVVRYKIFEKILRFIYTGHTYVSMDTFRELFEAAHYFDLAELLQFCQKKIAQNVLEVENVWDLYETAEVHFALKLKNDCILFALRNFEELKERKPDFIDHMIPKIHHHMVHLLLSGSLDCACPVHQE